MGSLAKHSVLRSLWVIKALCLMMVTMKLLLYVMDPGVYCLEYTKEKCKNCIVSLRDRHVFDQVTYNINMNL